MHVVAFDAYVAEERFREVGVERAESSDDLYAAADFITIHLPVTARDRELARRRRLREDEGRRARDQRRARRAAGRRRPKAALDSGKVGGAALDVFRDEPVTDHPLFGYPNVVVTPHLGASTAEATDRAGYQAAEQVVAALTGGVVTTAVNVPAVAAEDIEALGPFLPLSRAARPDRGRAGGGPSVDGLEVEYLGRIAERDTRLADGAGAEGRARRATPRRTSTT